MRDRSFSHGQKAYLIQAKFQAERNDMTIQSPNTNTWIAICLLYKDGYLFLQSE